MYKFTSGMLFLKTTKVSGVNEGLGFNMVAARMAISLLRFRDCSLLSWSKISTKQVQSRASPPLGKAAVGFLHLRSTMSSPPPAFHSVIKGGLITALPGNNAVNLNRCRIGSYLLTRFWKVADVNSIDLGFFLGFGRASTTVPGTGRKATLGFGLGFGLSFVAGDGVVEAFLD